MAVLEILTNEPTYEIILILGGVVGILLGIDRTIESDEHESSLLQIIAPLTALAVFGLLILGILNTAGFTNYTIFIMILFGIGLIAKPFRKLPLAFVISSVLGLVLFYFVYTNSDEEGEILSFLPIKWLIVAIIVIVILIFIISFVQEQAMDLLLLIMGWGPYVTVLSAIMIIQGITLIIDKPDTDGILGLLPG